MKSSYRTRTAIYLLVIFICGTVVPLHARTYEGQSMGGPIQMKGRLEVQFEADVNINRMAKSFGRVSMGIPTLDPILKQYEVYNAEAIFPWRQTERNNSVDNDFSRFYEFIFPDSIDVDEIMKELSQNPYVRSVSPVYAMPVSVVPNDTYYGSQWNMSKVMAPAAWETEKGSDTAKIAIVDTGVLYTHPDLADKIWVNPGEDVDGDGVVLDPDDMNGIDNDGNGIVDDLIGYDFFSGFTGISVWAGEDGATPDSDPKDFNGHGTHCAGISGAVSNNAVGVAGLAGGWGGGFGPYRGPRIMCIRVGASGNNGGVETGYVNTTNCAQGIDYAVKMGATVINCSWGSTSTAAMKAACNAAEDSGVVIIHAAGNDNSSEAEFLDLYTHDGNLVAIAAASTNSGDHKSSFSNYGDWIGVCAPGENIYNTYSNHYTATYAWLDGTSMSAPLVAGLAALIKSHMPQFRKPEIDSIIMNHADTIDYLNPSYVGLLGSGRINACSSLAGLPTADFSAGPVLMGFSPLTVDFVDQSPETPTSWKWKFGDGDSADIQNPSHTYTEAGFKTVSLSVDVPKGNATKILKNLVMVLADTIGVDSVMARPGHQAVIPIYLDNKYRAKSIMFPFVLKGSTGLGVDSFSVVGCRTSYFQDVVWQDYAPYYDPDNKKYTIRLRSDLPADGGSNYLAPGTGLMIYLYITDSATASGNRLITIDTVTLNSHSLKISSITADYVPIFKPGKLWISYARGDATLDGRIDLLDILVLISYKYKGGPPVDPYTGDANADSKIDLLDILYLIGYKYKGGPPPPL
jgi:subtilisin family serine protease